MTTLSPGIFSHHIPIVIDIRKHSVQHILEILIISALPIDLVIQYTNKDVCYCTTNLYFFNILPEIKFVPFVIRIIWFYAFFKNFLRRNLCLHPTLLWLVHWKTLRQPGNGKAAIQIFLPETSNTRPLPGAGWSPLKLQAHSVLSMLHMQSPTFLHIIIWVKKKEREEVEEGKKEEKESNMNPESRPCHWP